MFRGKKKPGRCIFLGGWLLSPLIVQTRMYGHCPATLDAVHFEDDYSESFKYGMGCHIKVRQEPLQKESHVTPSWGFPGGVLGPGALCGVEHFAEM